MQSQSKIFDDFAKVATGAAGTFAGAAREFETQTREKVREWLGGIDMVGRDEFEACRALAARAMGDVELLKAEIAQLKAMHASTQHASTQHASGAPASAVPATPHSPADHAPSAEAARGGAGPDGQPTA